MSSPKHAAIRDELALQLQSSPHRQAQPQARYRSGYEGETETDTFMENYSRGSSPQHRKTDFKDNSSSKCCSGKTVWIVGVFISILLAIVLGFLIGYFTHYTLSNSSVSMTTDARKAMHQEAIGSVSQSSIEEYERLHTAQQCALGSASCTGDLTNTLTTQLRSMGFKVQTPMYNILLSYPNLTQPTGVRTMDTQGNILHTVELYGGAAGAGPGYGLAPTASPPRVGYSVSGGGTDSVLVTDVVSEQSMPVYLPYTASGTAKGDLVYVNHGNEADFSTLSDLGVQASGKIALVRQGLNSAFDQARIASSHGVVGLILYPDPSDMTSDMSMTSVMTPDLSGMAGDPLTPGCPAKDGIYRTSMDSANLPSIPIQPVSMETAAMLLSNLTGLPAEGSWVGGLNVTYHIGLTAEIHQPWFVELNVHNDVIQKPIYDVIATIEGSEYPDEYVLLGGHYSNMMTSLVTLGSSSMAMEAARVLGGMMESGWQPRRTVVVGLWEGSEFGHSGATEWVEENRVVLQDRAVAYIDLGGGGSGTELMTEASPLLQGMIMDAAEMLGLSSMVNIGALSGSGDHMPFSHMIGVPSARFDISHSIGGSYNSDSYTPPTSNDVVMSVSTTQISTQLILSLADEEVLGLDAGAMADTIMVYVDNVGSVLGDMMPDEDSMPMTMLKSAAADFMTAVQDLQGVIGSDSIIDSPITMTMVNSRLMYMERSFLDSDAGGTMGSVLYGMQASDTFSTVTTMMSNTTGSVSMDMVHQTLSKLQCTIQSATQAIGMSLS